MSKIRVTHHNEQDQPKARAIPPNSTERLRLDPRGQRSELKLTNDVITQPRVLDSGAISITSVMTAAVLAKRIYFNTFYDGRRYPLYTLTKK